MIWRLVPGTFRDLFRTRWKCSEGAGERSFWQYLTPDRNGERRRRIWKVESSCSLWSECSTWNGRSFPGSGWTGARTPSEQKGNVVYPLNDTRWTSLVSQSTWHKEKTWKSDQLELACCFVNSRCYLSWGTETSRIKNYVNIWKSDWSVLFLEPGIEQNFSRLRISTAQGLVFLSLSVRCIRNISAWYTDFQHFVVESFLKPSLSLCFLPSNMKFVTNFPFKKSWWATLLPVTEVLKEGWREMFLTAWKGLHNCFHSYWLTTPPSPITFLIMLP